MRARLERDGRGLDVGLATTADERESARRLVHAQYVSRGYAAPDPSGPRPSPFDALPETALFVARRGPAVVGTLTLVPDSELGLPMDAIYRAELAPRRRGRRLGEVTSFAVAPAERSGGLAVVMRLVRVVLAYAAEVARLDELCVAVNPRHADFYQRVCGFEPFAALKAYDRVGGAPAVGLVLDVHAARARRLPVPGWAEDFVLDRAAWAAILADFERDLAVLSAAARPGRRLASYVRRPAAALPWRSGRADRAVAATA